MEAGMPETPSHGDMVANILAVYDSATEVQKAAGRQWYGQAGTLVRMIAEQTGIAVHRVALTVSALSPRNPWRWNVFDAYAFAAAAAEGRTMPTATTFRRNRNAAWRACNGQDTWLTAAPKVRAFVEAILGDDNAVVVDTWAARVATHGELSNGRGKSIGLKAYAAIAHAYNVASNLRGESPASMQAITWLVAQTEGLATHRTGRHDLAFKAGTPEWLKAALKGEEVIA